MTAGRSLNCGDVVRKVGVCCTGCIDLGRIAGVLCSRDSARYGGFGLFANAGDVARAARRFGVAIGTPETRYSSSGPLRLAGCACDVGEGAKVKVAVKASTGSCEVIRVRSSTQVNW